MAEIGKKSALDYFKANAFSILATFVFSGACASLQLNISSLRTELKGDISSLRTAVNDIQQKITLIDPQTGKTISISEMFAILNNRVANVETMITKAANSLPEITSILIQIRDNAKGK